MRLVRIRSHTCNSGMGVACYALRQMAGLETWKLLYTLPSKGESLNKARQFVFLFPPGATESSGPGWAAETFLLRRDPTPTPQSRLAGQTRAFQKTALWLPVASATRGRAASLILPYEGQGGGHSSKALF